LRAVSDHDRGCHKDDPVNKPMSKEAREYLSSTFDHERSNAELLEPCDHRRQLRRQRFVGQPFDLHACFPEPVLSLGVGAVAAKDGCLYIAGKAADMTCKGGSKRAVEHDPMRVGSTLDSARQLRVIRDYGSNADKDRIMFVAKAVR